MIDRRTGGACVALALAVLPPACTADGFGPSVATIEATYALRTVNGVLVPATVAQGGGQQYILMADTLRFTAAGDVFRSFTYRHISTTFSPPDTIYRTEAVFPYTLAAGRLTIGRREPCPPNALCVGDEEGTITPFRATITGRIFWPGDPVLAYQRVAGS